MTKRLHKFSVLIVVFLRMFGVLSAQNLDSIRYSQGFLYYQSYGDGNPIIILSGGPGNNCRQLEDMALELGKNFKSILFHQRGTGLSIPKRFDTSTITLAAAVDDLLLLLADRFKPAKVTIVGHSWGGTLALAFATTYPQRVKQLVLIAPGLYKSDSLLRQTFIDNKTASVCAEVTRRLNELKEKEEHGRLRKSDSLMNESLYHKAYLYNEEDSGVLENVKMGATNQKTLRLMSGNLKKIKFDLTLKIRSMTVPISIICGRQDPLAFSSYELKILKPSAQLYWIEKCGHYPMFEAKEQLLNILYRVIK